MTSVSSHLDSSTTLPAGGFIAAVRRAWYRRVFNPITVEHAKPPMPFVSSHSRDVASPKLCRISRGTRIMVYPPCMRSDNNVFFISLELTLMRRLFIFIFLCSCQSVFAEKHEIGLTLGGLFLQDLGTNPNAIRLGAGTALQANYGRRLINSPVEV